MRVYVLWNATHKNDNKMKFECEHARKDETADHEVIGSLGIFW